MLRHLFRITPLGTLNYIKKLRQPACNRMRLAIQKYAFGTAGFCGVVHAKHFTDEYATNFEDEIKRATKEGEKYLAQLMLMLRTLILQTSIEYQQCLIKQIEITRQNTHIGPVGEHWDRLVGFRVKGKELKEELTKYEALAINIADIVHHEASSLFFGNEIVLKELNFELEKLQKLCSEQLEEIHKYEAELLAADRESILYGVELK